MDQASRGIDSSGMDDGQKLAAIKPLCGIPLKLTSAFEAGDLEQVDVRRQIYQEIASLGMPYAALVERELHRESILGNHTMFDEVDGSPSEFTKFREAVIKFVLGTYVTTLEEVEMIAAQELDTLQDIFEDGSVEEAATMLAVLHDLEDK